MDKTVNTVFLVQTGTLSFSRIVELLKRFVGLLQSNPNNKYVKESIDTILDSLSNNYKHLKISDWKNVLDIFSPLTPHTREFCEKIFKKTITKNTDVHPFLDEYGWNTFIVTQYISLGILPEGKVIDLVVSAFTKSSEKPLSVLQAALRTYEFSSLEKIVYLTNNLPPVTFGKDHSVWSEITGSFSSVKSEKWCISLKMSDFLETIKSIRNEKEKVHFAQYVLKTMESRKDNAGLVFDDKNFSVFIDSFADASMQLEMKLRICAYHQLQEKSMKDVALITKTSSYGYHLDAMRAILQSVWFDDTEKIAILDRSLKSNMIERNKLLTAYLLFETSKENTKITADTIWEYCEKYSFNKNFTSFEEDEEMKKIIDNISPVPF